MGMCLAGERRMGQSAWEVWIWSSNWARTKAFLLQASGCQKYNCGERIWMSDLATSILDLRVFTEHIPSISYFVYFFLPILELGKVSG